ncbi:MAG: DUF4298 domain-containing protein [Parasporobacterium sp.]|nr:DUF4298 domain-containing protein [Parasporobacterium sp.]
MDQIERIKKMSSMLKSSKAACEELEEAMNRLAEALESYEKELDNIDALSAYYDSEDWLKDFADDEAGLIPQDIDRGALSEDGIYNLLSDQKGVEEILRQIKIYLQTV